MRDYYIHDAYEIFKNKDEFELVKDAQGTIELFEKRFQEEDLDKASKAISNAIKDGKSNIKLVFTFSIFNNPDKDYDWNRERCEKLNIESKAPVGYSYIPSKLFKKYPELSMIYRKEKTLIDNTKAEIVKAEKSYILYVANKIISEFQYKMGCRCRLENCGCFANLIIEWDKKYSYIKDMSNLLAPSVITGVIGIIAFVSAILVSNKDLSFLCYCSSILCFVFAVVVGFIQNGEYKQLYANLTKKHGWRWKQ